MSDNDSKTALGETSEKGAYIYLIRHGETALNKENKLRGWTNPPLNREGQKQADKARDIFSPIDLDAIHSSDLTRATETAEAIAGSQDVTIMDTPNLRPINFGDWNGKPLSQVEPKMIELQEDWKKHPSKKAPNGESFTEFQSRMLLIAKHMLKGAKPGKRVLMVAHLRNCIWMLAYALNGQKPLEGDSLDLLNRITQQEGQASVLFYGLDKTLKVLAMNTDDVKDEDSSPKPALEKDPKS
jgi:probable phosphoglycerate mutase